MRHHPTLTPDKINRIYFSLQYMSVMASAILLEHANEIVDTDFKIPHLNQFGRRIKTDTEAIIRHLSSSGRITIKNRDNEFLEEYASSVWEVCHYLIGMPLSELQETVSKLKENHEHTDTPARTGYVHVQV